MPQAIVRTEDVIECLDDRIHTTTSHPNLGVVAGEAYPSVLEKIEAQVCTPGEKAALTHTLTDPSTINPIVLKDDVQTYYPQDDLGDFRDAVATLLDLPLTGNNLNDLRPVLSENAIYRWDGSAWQPFIRTGTIDHTQLSNQNGDTNYLHISLSELSSLSTQSHTHSNKLIVDAIASFGSGIVISNDERSRLPTPDQKDALAGSSYSPPSPPASTNRYVTSIDPRLNTIKNPYVTFGPLTSGTTYQGNTIIELQAAFTHLGSSGDVEYIDALELLPYTYLNDEINYLGISWTDPKPLFLEALALRQSVLQLAPQPSGSTAFWVNAGDGRVVIRGLTFELGGTATIGVLIDRDDTILEDCTFTTASFPIPVGDIGLRITGKNVNVRRCVFNGNLALGIDVLGDNCFIENCRFDLANKTYLAIHVGADDCQVTSCVVSRGTFSVAPLMENATFDKNRMTANTAFIDAGTNTRWLGGIAQDYQQAYIGRTRTVGLVNSHADFRGTTEAPFIAALADPYTTEIEILDGTYTFASPVVVPVGKSLKTTRKGTVNIIGANCFILNSTTKLAGFNLSVTGASGITAVGQTDVEIRDCVLVMGGPDSPTSYAINVSSVTDFRVVGCEFSGTRGINLVGSSRARITHSLFSSSIYSVVTDASTTDLHYAENTEEGSVCLLAGTRAIIRGNHFLGTLPTKLGTTDSLWVGNYPITANNPNGIDTIKVSMGDLMRPVVTTGAARSSFLGTSSIAFLETGTPTIVTPPIFLGARIDRTQGYEVNLMWTAAVFSGDVVWEVSAVFRDREPLASDLGTPTVKTVLSSRTHLTVRQEETVTVTFSSSEFGYIAGVDPTHVSLMIRRLGDDALDTMAGIAYLTEAVITLARD